MITNAEHKARQTIQCSAACDVCKANKPVKQNKELQVEKDSYKMLD
jgi:hypothetical protein